MKILLTGANGYIGKRLLPLLVQQGHTVVALVRSAARLPLPEPLRASVQILEADLLDPKSLESIPSDIDAVYYLVHSMHHSATHFSELEETCARHLVQRLQQTKARQIIYLSGLADGESLSRHMASRHYVEEILRQGSVPVTILRSGIIIGSGSASFEIIRDLVEKLPVMIAPKWILQKTQPIAIHDVLQYLVGVLGKEICLNRIFEVGGPDVFTYKELLLRFAKVRGLKRWILTVPVLTPKLSSYWLYFVTSASFSLSRSLVESLKVRAVCKETTIREIVPFPLLRFEEAIQKAFQKIEEQSVLSSWKDAWVTSGLDSSLSLYIQVPTFGCLIQEEIVPFAKQPQKVQQTIWSLGGTKGWLTTDWAWKCRGWIDKCVGGIGLRRGRTHPTRLSPGDALDFWRVLLADEQQGRLLLYAEMKLPGEAWLEFQITSLPEGGGILRQTATFRPHGIAGRLYWWGLYPLHRWIFWRLSRALVSN